MKTQKNMNQFEIYKNNMINFLSKEYELNGSVQSKIPSLDFYFATKPTEQIYIMYEPSLCIILQGSKAVGFGDEVLSYNPKEYLIASTYLPAKMKITDASFSNPYISLRIKFRLEDIYEILNSVDLKEIKLDKNAQKGLFFGDMNIELYESIYRLVNLLSKEDIDIQYLQSLYIKEVLYNLIKSDGGTFLKKFSSIGTNSNKIIQAINIIKQNVNEKLNIKELSFRVDMSQSSLFQYFKAITKMSPIQFQKNLRLEEAKQLLTFEKIAVNEIAYKVGYESPSQFSREFSRMYGVSPKQFVNAMK
jgi:AraC-like DNA-binding protein